MSLLYKIHIQLCVIAAIIVRARQIRNYIRSYDDIVNVFHVFIDILFAKLTIMTMPCKLRLLHVLQY